MATLKSFSIPIIAIHSLPSHFHTRHSHHLTLPRCTSSQSSLTTNNKDDEQNRPPFDLNLAVLLAGFAFEAYSSPPEKVGRREVDGAGCQTVFLSEQFLKEVYDGQLFVKLRRGVDLPAMDPWGTSDPYVVIQLDGQTVKSNVKWATKEPIWNEEFTLNIKISPTKSLQVMAWDANLVTPHKRLGNTEIKLESLCDGNLHEVEVELEGIGGGGRLYLEVKYKTYSEIDEEKEWWSMSFVSDFLIKSPLGSALKSSLGSQSVNSSQFVEAAFRQFKSFTNPSLQKPNPSDCNGDDLEDTEESMNRVLGPDEPSQQQTHAESSTYDLNPQNENDHLAFEAKTDGDSTSLGKKSDDSGPSDNIFWNDFLDILNESVLQKFGFSLPEIKLLEGFDLLNTMSIQSQRVAEEDYVEYGLASPQPKDKANSNIDVIPTENATVPALTDIKRASGDVLNQFETILGALMVVSSVFPQQTNESSPRVQDEVGNNDCLIETGEVSGNSSDGEGNIPVEGMTGSTQDAEEMRKLFSSAESAMEAWSMLATSLGGKSFIRSEFEKICFLDNASTDTQVAIWRDSARRRLLVAFRGTEQTRWKDLQTDLMLLPAGFNPERLGGDFKQEVQVHSGFLNAYDSVRNRIMALIKLSMGYIDEDVLDGSSQWHVYVTGHSLGGALATLLALELCSSRMAKCSAISVTMYNFGSPRVGNRRFADVYNAKVKNSWRIVNHRDIIPTIPRLMGYCHVAQPVYLSAGDLKEALVNIESLGDDYQGDVIGESTPDVLVSEFMKGEKKLVEKILQTEINLLRTIRDGTALNQHMEDFYYITLLEKVRANYRNDDVSKSGEEGRM